MDEKRQGEIALAIFKYILKEDGFKNLNVSNIKRIVRSLSKRTGIPKKDFLEFGKIVMLEVLEETLTK